jgi:hypothetical protein
MAYRPDLHDIEVIWPDDLFAHLQDEGWPVEKIVQATRVTVVLRDRFGFQYKRVVMPKDFVSQSDVGRLLNIPVMTVIRWARSGKLPRRKKNGLWVMKLEDVLVLAAKLGRRQLATAVIQRSRTRLERVRGQKRQGQLGARADGA